MKNHGLRKQAQTCIHKPHAAYAGISLCTQLEFQRHKKGKFSALTTEVWNESHIIWESFQSPIFQLYKALRDTFSKHKENPKGKPKIH